MIENHRRLTEKALIGDQLVVYRYRAAKTK
jgi:hypothetical protein